MRKILLVDDEVDIRELLRRSLERQGFSVVTVDNGEAAVATMSIGFDAVVTDILMPRLDGIGLLKALANITNPPIRVVITNFADKARILDALNHGADYLIEKPFPTEQLFEIITKLIDQRSATSNLNKVVSQRIGHLNLNERENKIVIYLLRGLSNRNIANHMNTSEQGIKNSLHQIYQSLGIKSRSHLFHLIYKI